jgi:TrmH family RNA methyltransferase
MAENLLSPNNPQIVAATPAKRAKDGLALAEGIAVAREALAGSWEVTQLFLDGNFAESAEGEGFVALAKGRRVPLALCSAKAMEKLSALDSAPPVGALVRPPMIDPRQFLDQNRRVVVLDSLADPGNVGTLARAAVAFGFGCVLSGQTVSLTNEKFLRASAGTAFHRNALLVLRDPADLLAQATFQMLALAPRAGKLLAEAAAGADRLALVLGNEAAGIDPARWRGATAVRIPMAGSAESLNVSVTGAIAMYALQGPTP